VDAAPSMEVHCCCKWLLWQTGDSCEAGAAKLAQQSSGPTDCGAAPAPYINKPHRPPTRPTSCRFPPVSAPRSSSLNLQSRQTQLSITFEHVLSYIHTNPSPCLPRSPKALPLPPRPSLALLMPVTRFVFRPLSGRPHAGITC
jgi:hypothetical protein